RSGFSVSHRCSTTMRISRRRVSPSKSLTRLRSSLSTSFSWMSFFSSSKDLLACCADPWPSLDGGLGSCLPILAIRLRSFHHRIGRCKLSWARAVTKSMRQEMGLVTTEEESALLLGRFDGGCDPVSANQHVGHGDYGLIEARPGRVFDQRHSAVARGEHRSGLIGDSADNFAADGLLGTL